MSSVAALRELALDTVAVADVEIRKLIRDPTDLFTRSVQPLLWLLVFGQVFGSIRAIPTGSMSYREFLAPGILAQSVLFTAIFYGIGIIWERDLGILQAMLVTPAWRSGLVLGKAVAAGTRGIAQGAIVYGVAVAVGIPLRAGLAPIGASLALVMLGSAVFATFSLGVACIVKTRERFMGIGQLLTMPLFFASNAIYPLTMMPRWLRIIARLNPLTYLVDGLRSQMVHGAPASSLALDGAVLMLALVVLLAVTSKLYPTVVR